ncbi:DUF2754 family protein, partial [Salmonella enterica subsp. enterica serovar Virginia]|nr:DUF2754 family protein [Salmonella enterica subsp. enterica serovar Virginia]
MRLPVKIRRDWHYYAFSIGLILRFLQGFMVGGEWGGAMLMVVEYAAGKHRGRLSALSQTGGL